MDNNLPLHPNSSYYQMCICKRHKSDIIIIIIIRPPKPIFLDFWNNITQNMQKLRNTFFYLDIYIYFLRKINCLVSTTFTLEQKSDFKLERNKDLTFIVIIIDIDWYEKNYCDSFLGRIAPWK